MKHKILQKSEEQDVFTDLLFNALLGFAFMFAIAFMLINNSEESGKINTKAEVLISIQSVSYTHLTLTTILLV